MVLPISSHQLGSVFCLVSVRTPQDDITGKPVVKLATMQYISSCTKYHDITFLSPIHNPTPPVNNQQHPLTPVIVGENTIYSFIHWPILLTFFGHYCSRYQPQLCFCSLAIDKLRNVTHYSRQESLCEGESHKHSSTVLHCTYRVVRKTSHNSQTETVDSFTTMTVFRHRVL